MIGFERKGRKVFYGWWIVLASGVGLALHYGPIIMPTFGVFLKPISQDLGWNRAQVSLAFSLASVGITVATPLIGRLVDRFGARRVIMLAVILFGLSVASLSSLSAHLWHLYIVYLLIGIVGSGTTPVPYAKVISHWFDRKRGLALGLAVAALGLSASMMATVAQAIITWVGWRRAYLILGLGAACIVIPVVGLLLKEKPQVMGLEPDGESMGSTEMSKPRISAQGLNFRETWRTGTFWILIIAVFLMSVSFHGYFIHLVPLLTDYGLSANRAALIMSLGGVTAVVGRIGVGYLLDHFFAPYVAMTFFVGFALAMVLLYMGVEGALLFIAVFLAGVGMGTELDFMPFATSRYFGLRTFGEIYSYMFAAHTLGGVVGPLLMGAVFDATGSYRLALAVFMATSLTAAGLMTRLGPYRAWAADL